MKGAYVAFGSVLLVFGAVMFISVNNLVPQLSNSLGQIGPKAFSSFSQQATIMISIGQKLSPILALGGAVCLGYGIRAK